VFHFLPGLLGNKEGYFFGFLFYWIFWCLTIPIVLIGKTGIASLYTPTHLRHGAGKLTNVFLLLMPLTLAYGYEFPRVVGNANVSVILISAILSVVNASVEEILWRGAFQKVLGNSNLIILFSSFGFAIWHFAPQLVFGNRHPGGSASFVAVAFLLGLAYAQVTRSTGSILWPTVSHILFDFSGLGARIYFE
ncbi:MAG TPA: CPBP family intramembrane glutamic endopeptidase, partial [Cyclobacteriaceae bacterium]|nr:CPBP family intramembrane glutamic endopeptidase [Cyclobacteriaceae bacterium]